MLRRWPFALFLVLSLGQVSVCQSFKLPSVVRSGNITSTAEADFDGDGKIDLVYLEGIPQSTVHSLLNAGNGIFSDAQNVQLPIGFSGKITIADVNRDSKLDIVIGSSAANIQVVVLLGNGDGTFGAPVVSDLGPATPNFSVIRSGFGVADLNHDGNMDLFVPDSQDYSIYILSGDGTGKFTLGKTIGNSSGPVTPIVADLNLDGNPDFVVYGGAGADVYVYLGNSDGTLQTGIRYTGLHHIYSFLLYDMDGDGAPDLVISNQAYGIEVFHGHVDGTFDANSEGGMADTGFWLTLLAAGDFNGDGIPDLYATSSDGIVLLTGQANLTFNAPVLFATPSTNCSTSDIDSDGHLDIIAAYDTGVSILKGNADGSLQTTDTYFSGSYGTAILGDFNGDHRPDIALVGDPNEVPALVNDGGGKFHLNQAPNPTNTYIYPVNGITGDFNGDSRSDLFTEGNGFAQIQFAGASGVLSAPVQVSLGSDTGFSPYGALAVGDFNQDGRADLVIPPFVLLGQSNNSFVSKSSGDGLLHLSRRTADLNKDGHQDVVGGGDRFLEVSLGDGTGQLVNTGRSYDTSIAGQNYIDAPTSISVADIDGDGNIDAATTISSGPYVEIFYGRGDGTLEDAQLITVDRRYWGLFLADVDQDGKPDLILNAGPTTSVLRHTSPRTFGGAVRYSLGANLIDVADMNGDSLPDLVIQNGPNSVAIAYNQPGPGTIAAGMTIQPEPSEQTKPITLTLTFATAQGKPGPTGTVAFRLDGFELTAMPVTGAVMTYVYTNTANLDLGPHLFSAVYSGDANYQSGSFAAGHTVVPLQFATKTSLTSSASTSLSGQGIVFRATVTAVSGTRIPFGTVAFHDGVTNLGTRSLDNSGVAVFDTGLLRSGSHTVTALFIGNPYFGASQSNPVNVQINTVTTSVALTADPNPAPAGSAVLLKAQVDSLSGTPTGAVTFYDGTTPLETRTVDASGTASFGTTFNSGTHVLSASYIANSVWGGSSSGVTVVSNATSSSSSVVIGKSDFAVQVTDPKSAASRGVAYRTEVRLLALWGFNSETRLTCAVSDPGALCSFEPSVLTKGSGSSQLTVVLKPASPNAGIRAQTGDPGQSAVPVLAVLIGMGLLRPTRRLRRRLIALACSATLLFSLACGQNPELLRSTVMVTVTATSGSGQSAIIHSDVLKILVQ